MVRGCLIDVYDTLLTSGYVSRMQALIQPFGLAINDWLAEWSTMREERDRGRMTVAASIDRTLRQLGVEPAPGMVAELAQRDADLARASVRLCEDTIPFLTWLRARGISSALVSNCADTTRAQLDYLGIPPLVDAMVLSCEVGSMKPYPDIYVTALEDLGVAAVDAVFLDDQPIFCAAAQALGIRAIQVARGEQETRPSGWDFPVIRTLEEAKPLLLPSRTAPRSLRQARSPAGGCFLAPVLSLGPGFCRRVLPRAGALARAGLSQAGASAGRALAGRASAGRSFPRRCPLAGGALAGWGFRRPVLFRAGRASAGECSLARVLSRGPVSRGLGLPRAGASAVWCFRGPVLSRKPVLPRAGAPAGRCFRRLLLPRSGASAGRCSPVSRCSRKPVLP